MKNEFLKIRPYNNFFLARQSNKDLQVEDTMTVVMSSQAKYFFILYKCFSHEMVCR